MRKLLCSFRLARPNWLYKTLTLAFLVFVSIGVHAQVVSGTIVDEDGIPVIGANVAVAGTSMGVVTDVDGSFSVDLKGNNQLEISYLGYKTQVIDVNDQTSFNIVLAPDTQQLDDIVVVGYGTQKRSNITGAIASIDGPEITNIVTGNPTTALQGKLAGIQVESFGGQPGSPANVFVRGIGSLTNSFPLYVVDGTFAENINFLNPNDIESIEVLKDASSAAIYGARASNGVVIVTTKSGSDSGKTQVSLSTKIGFETPSRRLDFLNSEQFLDYRDDVDSQGSGFMIDRSNFIENGELIYTDWQEESFKTAGIYDVGIGVSGGSENSKYYISTNYFNQDGILIGSGFERFNLRGNSQFTLGKFKISQSLGLTQSETEENEYFGFEAATAPILRLSNPNNLGGFEAPERDIFGFGGLNNYALATLEDNALTQRNLLGNISASYEIINGLTAKVSVGAEYTNSFRSTFRPTYFMSSTDARFNDNPQNDLSHIRSEFFRTQIEPTLTYENQAGNHDYSVVLGTSRIVTQFDILGTYVGNLPSNQISTVGAAGTENILASVGASEVDALLSAFGRINYSYNNKYLVSATLRRDESSRFAEGFRADVFPSFSLGWRIDRESFFPANNVLTSLKLRFGYGELGAQNIGNYLFQSTFGSTSAASFGNTIFPGFAQTNFANESLQWETSATTNAGVDFELWDGQFTGSLEYYIKNIDNLLVPVPIPASNGTSLPVIQNAGGLRNSGLEFEMNYRKRTGEFTYDVGFNLGTQRSILDELPTEFFGPSVSEDIQVVNLFREGEAPGSFYGFVVEGIDPETGDFIFKDEDGVDGPDFEILGSPVPDFTYGLNFNANYKNFDLGLFFNGVHGNEIYNQARAYNTLFADGNKLTEVVDRWTPDNTDAAFPRAGTPYNPSSFFVEDGSYFRLKNLALGYNLGNVISISGVESIRLSVTAQNVFVLTNYSGYDPDVASTNGARSNENDGFFGFRPTVNPIIGRGIDIRAYPNARGLLFGLNCTF